MHREYEWDAPPSTNFEVTDRYIARNYPGFCGLSLEQIRQNES